MKDQKKDVAYEPQIKLTLNGGGLEMDGATIPVKWFFSEELIIKEPKYLVFFDFTDSNLKQEAVNLGRRYVVKVEDAVKFLQIFKSGHHLLLALTFDSKENALKCLSRNDNGVYSNEVPLENVKTGESWLGSLGVGWSEFEVPEGLFARPPENKWGKIWWNYLFWPNRPKAKDECQVRKLAWFFSLPKLPLFVIINLLYILYHAIAPLIVLFVGYQAIGIKNIFQKVLHPVVWGYSFNVLPPVSNQKFLAIYDSNGVVHKKMWFSPLMLITSISLFYFSLMAISELTEVYVLPLILIVAFILFVITLIKNIERFVNFDFDDLIPLFIIILIVVSLVISFIFTFYIEINPGQYDIRSVYFYGAVFAFLIFSLLKVSWMIIVDTDWYNNYQKKKSKKSSKQKVLVKESYREYLSKFFSDKNLETKVSLDNLPKTFQKSQIKRDTVIRFWDLKAKVCRPFEEN